MSLKIARFHFNTPVHFGEAGIGIESTEEIVHSDTLFSALCHSWAVLYGKADLDDLLISFERKSPFLISSCFVYNNNTYFLPKPHTPPPGFENVDIREKHGKDIKGLNYLPREIFGLWARREKINYETIKENYGSSYRFFLVPRVAIDRANSSSQIYYCGTIKFQEGCGLFCLIKLNDISYEQKVKMSLSLLGELGLGGERSSGLGKFKLIWEDADSGWDRLLLFKGDSYLCLSLFHPENLETIENLVNGASYALLERRGWFLSPFSTKQYKRKTVTMFAEGSVFTKEITGHLVPVAPEIWIKEGNPHPIYRYGYAFTIPVKLKE